MSLMTPIKSKIMLPDNEQDTVANILKKNASNITKTKDKNKKPKKPKKSQISRPKKNHNMGKKRKGKKREKKTKTKEEKKEEKKEIIDPYIQLKSTDPNILLRMFLHKLINYPFVSEHLGQFGDQLQSNMINFSRDMILPMLMSLDNIQKFESIINDRKLIYLLRQSFIRWLLIHKNQIKLLFKRKGDKNSNNKLLYNIIISKNHIIQKLSNTLTNDKNDLKNIINKLDIKTKLKYFHYLKSDIKNPFLAQLMTPIPNKLLSNTKCNVPSLSGKMPNIIIEEETKNDNDNDNNNNNNNNNNIEIQNKLNKLFDGYKDCVLLSEKQILVDILKTQYKLIQNAIDDYGKIRWMDAPIDHGHIRLMQRELIRDHELIIKKCRLIENDYKKKLLQNINEVNKMRNELNKRKNIYLNLIENKCFRFLKEKLSQIHEEIERKKQAIALHEKKRENYLNHAKESLKNEQNMRKGVKLVNDTYHKYLRQLTRSKIEYAVIDNKLTQEQFYRLQEKLNNLRNKNDRYWYWYKKEKQIYTKSIKTFSRINRFFKKIEEFLIKEYGENSDELIMFRCNYYLYVLKNNVTNKELNNKYNKEIFEKKKISDIEIVYNMKKKDIKLPKEEISIINRLYKKLKPNDLIQREHERNITDNQNKTAMFVNNRIKKHQDYEQEKEEIKEKQIDINQHINDTDDEEQEQEQQQQQQQQQQEQEQQQHTGYIKTNDEDIFANVNNDNNTDSQFLLSAEKTNRKKGKRNTQNVWKGKVESTVFYNEGDNANKDISAGPHLSKHYSVYKNKKLLQDTYEDSTQYHIDDDDDPNRPSSTIFKNEPIDEPQFFKEQQFFTSSKNNNTELKEEIEPEDKDDENDIYQHRIKISNSKHEKAQNSVSVSGFGQIGTSYDDEFENDNVNGLVSPSTPYNDDQDDNQDDQHSEDQFDDNMEHNVINDDDMGNMSFESDEEDDSSYVDSDQDD